MVMKPIFGFLLFLTGLPGLLTAANPAVHAASPGDRPAYLHPGLPVEERINDLMTRLSLAEKVGQMCQYIGNAKLEEDAQFYERFGRRLADFDDNTAYYRGFDAKQLEQRVQQGLVGSFLFISSPAEGNRLQALAATSPNQIPLLFGIDAIHGHGYYDGPATIFPTLMGLASTRNPALVEAVGRATALEMRATGFHWTFSPELDLARDPRWGRAGETFGEDPFLVSVLGAAMIRGYQFEQLSSNDVMACAKAYIAGGEPTNGLNFASMDLSERTLREIWLPPYAAAIQAGVGSVMAAHHDINGVPCHANPWLLTDLLRNELNFDGFVVSDWTDITRLVTLHRTAEDSDEANREAVAAGIDMHMHGPGFLESVVEAVESGQLAPERIEAACRAILRAKFKLGLFENRYVDEDYTAVRALMAQHRSLALEAARQSIVLLENRHALLPLDPARGLRIYVGGPFADSDAVLGDWVIRRPGLEVQTLWTGLRSYPVDAGEWVYHPMDPASIMTEEDLQRAADLARGCDVALLILGENAVRNNGVARTSGENFDRSQLDLPGRQLELFRRVAGTGVPTIVTLVHGRALAIPEIAESAAALLTVWEPGAVGGTALAEVIFGACNPGARLPVSIPRNVGQLPVYYNQRPSSYFRTYVDVDKSPLYPFGHGLSYSSFVYSELQVSPPPTLADDQDLELSVLVENNGPMPASEVVLVFLRDEVAEVTTPGKRLVGFSRVELPVGAKKRLQLSIPLEQLKYLDMDLLPVLEAGRFQLWVGPLNTTFSIAEPES